MIHGGAFSGGSQATGLLALHSTERLVLERDTRAEREGAT